MSLSLRLTFLFAALGPVGTAAAQFGPLDAAIEAGVRRGVYPGAAVVVGTSTRILHAKGYGHFTWAATSAMPHPDSTIWDIASLTKVVATTGGIALLVDRGRVALDAPVRRYLPRFTGGGREQVTVRMLLDHTSGLPAGLDPNARPRGRDSVLALVYRTPLRRAAGARAQYSDVNAILLGLIIESVSGKPLDRFVAEELFRPLAMRGTRYLPPREWRGRIAPTAQWRGSPLSGEVNDATSGRMGGVAGHAGVFAPATDLARYARWWLRTARRSARRRSILSSRSPAVPGSSVGNRAPPTSTRHPPTATCSAIAPTATPATPGRCSGSTRAEICS
jgi:CubicO group peptidase (beta-lactamase class C family)